MQNDPEFRRLASVVEYWTYHPSIGNTYAMLEGANGQDKGCIVLVANETQRRKLKKEVADHVTLMTLQEAKMGKLQGHNKPMVMDHLTIAQLLIEMSGVGMRHRELAKAEVYNALLTGGMIKPEYQKDVYMRAQEIERKT